MKSRLSTIVESRPLTPVEIEFVRWLLEHGGARAQTFLSQLNGASVTSRCGCGCASFDVSISGITHCGEKDVGMETLCDYQWRTSSGALCGAFAFACAGVLAGIELWSIDGQETPSTIPPVSVLEPLT